MALVVSTMVDLSCDMVAGGGRLGFKKRWGRDEGWVVYGFEGASAFSFSVFLVCGSELCGSDWEMNWESGSDWEMKWWEGGSDWEMRVDRTEKFWGSDWEMSYVDRTKKWKRETHREWRGSAVWERGSWAFGVRETVELSVSELGEHLLLWRVRVRELRQSNVRSVNGLKWKWKRKMFYALGPLFYGQHWKYFQFDPIFRSNQTYYFTEKHFWN